MCLIASIIIIIDPILCRYKVRRRKGGKTGPRGTSEGAAADRRDKTQGCWTRLGFTECVCVNMLVFIHFSHRLEARILYSLSTTECSPYYQFQRKWKELTLCHGTQQLTWLFKVAAAGKKGNSSSHLLSTRFSKLKRPCCFSLGLLQTELSLFVFC